MKNINLLISNANNAFTPSEIAIIKDAAVDAEVFIGRHFTFDYDVDIVIATPSNFMQTIAEDGISGRTYHSRFIVIVIDKAQAQITKKFVYETICHEMSHSLRWEKHSEYAETLFQGMILEGLAVALEEKAHEEDDTSSDAQFFLRTVQQTTQSEYAAIEGEVKKSFNEKRYDYETLFYTGNDTLPRWAGYRLGYYYVKQYLEKTGRSIEEAMFDDYGQFAAILNV